MTLWYVDNSLGTGSNNGTSWANAWKTIAAVTWASLGPNDTLYISGGSTSQTYNEVMLVGAHTATAGNPLTVTAGDGTAGHTGTVIIDGTSFTTINSSSAIIDTNSKTNLIIQNMTLQNTFENCLYIHGVSSGAVVANNLIIHTGTGQIAIATSAGTIAGNSTLTFASSVIPAAVVGIGSGNLGVQDATHTAIPRGTTASSVTSTTIVLNTPVVAPGVSSGDTINIGANARGIRIASCSGGSVTIQNCTIDTPNSTVSQTDCLYHQSNSGCTILIQNNSFTVNNSDSSGHSDCIQGFSDAGTLRGNFLYHPNGGQNNHGIIVSDPITGQTWDIYNNVIIMGQSAGHPPETGIFLQATIGTGFLGGFNVYNNTVYGGFTCVEYACDANSPTSTFAVTLNCRNNIFYALPFTFATYYLFNGHAATSPTIDFNVVFPLTRSDRVINNSGSRASILGTVSQTSGLQYFEFQVGDAFTSGNTGGGVGNASASLTFEAGHTTNSIGFLPLSGPGEVEFNNGTLTSIMGANPWDVIGCAVDFTNSKIWWIDWSAVTPQWNNAAIGSQNPVGNVGGIALSVASGPYFPMLSVGASGDYVIFNGGSAPFLGTMPTGYTAWGGVLNSGAIGAGATLTPYVSFDGGSTQAYDLWATWQGFGFDSHGANSDPQFMNAGSPVATSYQLANSGSVAYNGGTTISLVTTDFNGQPRPGDTKYCIGAFETVFSWPSSSTRAGV